jgi:hypothetical protein
MKKFIFILLAYYSVGALFAQSPNQIQYQAIIRNASGAVVANQAVGMRVSLLKTSATGNVVYAETHRDTTSANGLVTVEIGVGTVVSGSFASVNWGQGPYFIKTETDITGGTNYTLSSTSQILSVPYAIHASNIPVKKSGDTIFIGISKLIVAGSSLIPAYIPRTINDGLVAFYLFSGNAADSSGKGNHGVPIGVSLTADRNGNANKAYLFPGNSNAFINVPITSALGITKEISISAWIYMDGGTINPRIISVMNGTCEGFYLATYGLSNISRRVDGCFYEDQLCTVGSCISSNDVSALKWNHIVYTVDASGLSKIYINGSLISTKTGIPITNADYFSNINIGRKAGSSFDAWGGKIDDIRIYNRVINHEEIYSLYNLQ